MSYEYACWPQNHFITTLPEKGNVSARERLAGPSTVNMQRGRVKKHNVKGFISHQGLKGHFLRVLFIQLAGNKCMTIKMWMTKKNLQRQTTRPLLFLFQTSSSHHNSQPKPEKKANQTLRCYCSKVAWYVSVSGLQRSQVHPVAAPRCCTRQTGSEQHGWGWNTGPRRRRFGPTG